MPGLNSEGKTMIYAHFILLFQRNPNVCVLNSMLTLCMCALNSLCLRYACVRLTHCAHDMRVCA